MRHLFIAIAGIFFSSAVLAAPADVLGLYQFNNLDLTDSSGNGFDGTAANGLGFTQDGRSVGNGAATFNATQGTSGFFVPIDVNASELEAVTFGAWVNVDPSTQTLGKFISHDSGSFDRTVGLDNRGAPGGNRFSLFTGQGVIAGPERIDNVWTHVAASWDGDLAKLYVNGVLVNQANDTTDSDVGFTSLHIGTNPGFNEDFVGLMDDVFVYGRALEDGEVTDIFASGFATAVPLPTGLPLLAGALFILAAARIRRRSA